MLFKNRILHKWQTRQYSLAWN